MKKPSSLSRGTEINLEQCVENAGGNRFDLVIMASARARELARRHKHDERKEHIHPTVTALLEFQSGKFNKDYLKRVK